MLKRISTVCSIVAWVGIVGGMIALALVLSLHGPLWPAQVMCVPGFVGLIAHVALAAYLNRGMVTVAAKNTALQDSWLGTDKLLHLVCSALIVLVVRWVCIAGPHWEPGVALGLGCGVAAAAGLLKEVLDSRLSWKDLVADLAGIVLMAATLGQWTRLT